MRVRKLAANKVNSLLASSPPPLPLPRYFIGETAQKFENVLLRIIEKVFIAPLQKINIILSFVKTFRSWSAPLIEIVTEHFTSDKQKWLDKTLIFDFAIII